MKPTVKIRFTEPQIALVLRAHPNCNLDRLTELSFEFDRAGTIVDCILTIKDGGNIDHDYAGSGLARLYKTARRQLTVLGTDEKLPRAIFAFKFEGMLLVTSREINCFQRDKKNVKNTISRSSRAGGGSW
jgi:hypothetical protein